MTSAPPNYFRYFTLTPEMKRWGVGITGAGTTKIAPGESYLATAHPPDHFLDWAHGRVLDHLQIVLITAGSGWLETRAAGHCRVEGGMVFLLLPKTWHRYRPDPAVGWDESWLELAGPVVDELLKANTYPAASVLRKGALNVGLDESFTAIHRRLRSGMAGHEPELAAATLRVLSILTTVSGSERTLSRIQRAVQAGQEYLSAHHAEPVNMEALAARLGVAYSHFRREFRARTGLAPWRYVVQVRLTRARRLLATNDAKLEEVAEQVGFSSGFHFSQSFKQAYGLSPSAWRKTLARRE